MSQNMASRSNPSMSKVQFLLHLRESHEWAAQACNRNADAIIGLFRSPLPVTLCTHNRIQACQRHIDDFRYLATELENQANRVEDLRDVIVGQIELFDKRRNRTIGLLVAIYVPLAFATVRFLLAIGSTTLTGVVILWNEHRGSLSVCELDEHHLDKHRTRSERHNPKSCPSRRCIDHSNCISNLIQPGRQPKLATLDVRSRCRSAHTWEHPCTFGGRLRL